MIVQINQVRQPSKSRQFCVKIKIFYCFFILFGIGNCIDADASDSYWREYVNDGVYQYDGNYEDNSDRSNSTDPIIFPCAVHDTHCIRRFFAQTSRCSPVEGPTPDPYVLKRLPLNMPHANISFTLNNAPVKGLHNWRIQEFYINKSTDRLVLEVVFDKIVVSTPKADLFIYRKGKEPIELSDFSAIEYDNVSLTLTIPHVKDIQLSRGHVYAYLPDAFPKYVLGPKLLSSTDPDAILALAVLTGNAGLSIRELYVNQGPVLMSIFLQSTICNFGYH